MHRIAVYKCNNLQIVISTKYAKYACLEKFNAVTFFWLFIKHLPNSFLHGNASLLLCYRCSLYMCLFIFIRLY